MWTHNVSPDAKTGNTLYALVTDDIKYSEETYGVNVVAVCSDDAGDAKKMHRLLHKKMWWLIVVLCWAHQINLIISDYLCLASPILDCITIAQAIIHWMNNHSCALGLSRQEQLQSYQKFLTLIYPVIMWWTVHYLSLRHLLNLKLMLRATWLKNGNEIIASAGPKSDVRAKTQAINNLIESKIFWSQVKMWVQHFL